MIKDTKTVISKATQFVIPACRESFFKEGCRTSRHDRNRYQCIHTYSRLSNRGITLIELLVTIAIISIIAAIAAPMLGLFKSKAGVRECATDLIQHMRVARAMAIKENREYLIVFHMAGNPTATINPQGRYLIGFDGDGDNDLTTVNSDTFGICKDTPTFDSDGDGILDRGDRLPDTDTDANGDSVPDCVRVVNLSSCESNIIFGYTSGTTPPIGPNSTAIPPSGINFSGTPPTAQFDTDGSMDKLGSVYFQQTTRGYSYCVRISFNAGATNMWKWDGDADNTGITTWTEIR